jgi:hypothetical protein
MEDFESSKFILNTGKYLPIIEDTNLELFT